MNKLAGCIWILAALCFPAPSTGQVKGKAPASVNFQTEVRPILSDACFHCHGPDKETRMAGLRLDTQEGAFATRKSGVPIVPGDSRASLIFQRITHENQARRMPPLSSHKSLSAKQVDTIRRWIEGGAQWTEHWAFKAPVRPTVPAVLSKAWIRNPIDAFILSKLEKNGLTPAGPADKRTLIRRVSLDITGLPPSPAEVEAFVKDVSPNAYEKLVDSLLASEHWGEHRGRYWLDAARYGDTHGIHIDNYRAMWPYRDWVINAFNRNIPFDKFTVEQIAGDLLPNPSMEQQIATGFHRCNVTTNEGGVIPEEVAAMYAKDRVDTTSTVFLGLTVGCATCHDHKFDPIKQTDFYSMAAFFRNTVQDPLDGNVHDTPPVIVVPRPEDMPLWKQLGAQQNKLEARADSIRKSSSFEFTSWLDGENRPKIANPLEPADELLAVTGRSDLFVRNKRAEMPLPDSVAFEEGPQEGTQALFFNTRAGIELPNFEYFDADKPFTISAWILTPKGEDSFTVLSQTDTLSRGRGWALELNGRIPVFRLTHLPNKTVSIRGAIADRWEAGAWNHITITYDGSRDLSGLDMLVNGTPVLAERRGDMKPIEGNFRTYAPLRLGTDGNRRFFSGGALGELRVYTRAISPEEAQLVMNWALIEQTRNTRTSELSSSKRDLLHKY
ncbi:MAG TPA: DUF1549 domain-containing protein, partial [Bryobacteraceae bacterium]|nr:DUF1549 domain-containing protein [Bryobacteraceae bacterium]